MKGSYIVNKKIIASLMVVLLVFSITACSNPTSQTTPPANVGDVFRIGIMPDVAAIPFVIGAKKGIFEKHGLNVQLIPFKSAQDRDAALQAGELEAVSSDLLALFLLQEAGIKFSSIGHTAGQFSIAFARESGVKEPTDFISGKVGLSFNTLMDYLLDRFISENILDSTKIEKVSVPAIPARLELLASNQLSAATLPEPLASSGKGEFSSVISLLKSPEANPSVFLVSDAFLASHDGYLDILKASYNEAIAYCNDEDISTYYSEVSEFIGFPPGAEKFQYKPFIELLPTDSFEYSAALDWAMEKGLVKTNFNMVDVCK